MVRNKSRLVAQVFHQKENIYLTKTFAPTARLEAIRIMFAFVAHKNIKLFQTDDKSVFLNGFIEEEIYVKQPPSFEDPILIDHIFKLKKALYGLK